MFELYNMNWSPFGQIDAIVEQVQLEELYSNKWYSDTTFYKLVSALPICRKDCDDSAGGDEDLEKGNGNGDNEQQNAQFEIVSVMDVDDDDDIEIIDTKKHNITHVSLNDISSTIFGFSTIDDKPSSTTSLEQAKYDLNELQKLVDNAQPIEGKDDMVMESLPKNSLLHFSRFFVLQEPG